MRFSLLGLSLVLMLTLTLGCQTMPSQHTSQDDDAPATKEITALPGALETKLNALRKDFETKVPHDKLQIMSEATQALKASGIEQQALKIGDTVPDFTLPNAMGENVALSTLLKEGPVVMMFYRGHWCPYCNVALGMVQSELPAIENTGAQLVAISPQTPDNSLDTKQKHDLAFEVLSDGDNTYAKQLGIVFSLSNNLRPLYQAYGIDLVQANGNKRYELPMAATYVVNTDRKITWAFVDADYTRRAEPEAIVAHLNTLKAITDSAG